MPETYTVPDDTAAMHEHLLDGVYSTIRSLQDMYPPDGRPVDLDDHED